MQPLLIEKHISFLKELNDKKDTLEYWHSEHLKLSAIYWSVTALYLLDSLDTYDKEDVIKFVLECYNEEDGGFGGSPGHDSHLLYTLSGIQILAIYNRLDRIESIKPKIIQFIKGLQCLESGHFMGDKWGEKDTRFSYSALNALSLLNALNEIDLILIANSIIECFNYDSGFGAIPGAESHAGQIFCCVSSLKIINMLDFLGDKRDRLAWWLAERQLPNGGLNGRPEKLEDVCYSWWVLSSLKTLDRVDWIDKDKLTNFILQCQDVEVGGFCDRPGHMSDVFHTLFGLTGLSLLGNSQLKSIDSAYCLPTDVLANLNN
ncbi:terpenoid cyclases/Protein prenyltransferase [Neoconidiobolus thromboides FSU 785]|nr:terpenoid cyclases/Protein prenyltransferase [Neoconidiobolus thromboides FSU 785]